MRRLVGSPRRRAAQFGVIDDPVGSLVAPACLFAIDCRELHCINESHDVRPRGAQEQDVGSARAESEAELVRRQNEVSSRRHAEFLLEGVTKRLVRLVAEMQAEQIELLRPGLWNSIQSVFLSPPAQDSLMTMGGAQVSRRPGEP